MDREMPAALINMVVGTGPGAEVENPAGMPEEAVFTPAPPRRQQECKGGGAHSGSGKMTQRPVTSTDGCPQLR
jgi:hypothetical protein